MTNKSNIAILSNVINFELYNITASYFPDGIQKYVIDGRNGMHAWESIKYWVKILKNKKIKWLILCDEDVVFENKSSVFDLIKNMEEKKIDVFGPRDGGEIAHRIYNPYLINTFFCILNLEKIYKIWNIKEIEKSNYINENEFQDNLSNLIYLYDKKSLYEPYYNFFLFLRRNGFNFHFFEVKMNLDCISNEIYFEGKKILTHTWHARSYGINKKHTDRINVILGEKLLKSHTLLRTDYIYFKDRSYYFKAESKKLITRVKMKLEKIITNKNSF